MLGLKHLNTLEDLSPNSFPINVVRLGTRGAHVSDCFEITSVMPGWGCGSASFKAESVQLKVPHKWDHYLQIPGREPGAQGRAVTCLPSPKMESRCPQPQNSLQGRGAVRQV